MPRRLLPALVCLLAACAQLPASLPEDSVALAPRPARASIHAFDLNGRIAVRQGQQHYAVGISWQHATARDDILLTTPLGQGVAELSRDAGGARLTTAEHREFSAPDWESLSVQVFGFALPLSALPRWLLADVPVAALGVKYDHAGRAERLVVDDWQVAYLEYESAAADALPILIELRRDDIEVRLKIDAWQLK